MLAPTTQEPCAPPKLVRFYALVKLLILFLLLILYLLFVRQGEGERGGISAPRLDPLPHTVLAGEIAFSGRGDAGSTVELLAGTAPLGSVAVAEDGRWALARPLPQGRYSLQARAVSGNALAAGAEGQGGLFVVERPTLVLWPGDVVAGRVEVALYGVGTPGSRVRVDGDAGPLATVTVGPEGRWQAVTQVGRASVHRFQAHVLDEAGEPLGSSPPRLLALPGPPPAGLVIRKVLMHNLALAAERGLVHFNLRLEGSGAAHSEIRVRQAGEPWATQATVLDDGSWIGIRSQLLPPGLYSYESEMVKEGRVLGRAPFEILVPGRPSLAVSGGETDLEEVILSGEAQAGARLALWYDLAPRGIGGRRLAEVTAGEDGRWTYRTHFVPGSYALWVQGSPFASERRDLEVGLFVPIILGQNADPQGQLLPGFYGIGRAHTTLEIVEGGELVGSAVVDREGRWRCNCALAPGPHTLFVREVEEQRRASAPLSIAVANAAPPYVPGPADPNAPPFRCPDPAAPGFVEGGFYVVGCGESLPVVAGSLGVTVEQLLEHNPQLGNPPRLYFEQRLNIPVEPSCVSADG